MNNLKLRVRIMISIGLALSIIFALVAYHYARSQRIAILTNYQSELHKITDAVSRGLQTVMLENHAEIMQDYADRLKQIRGFVELSIVRPDGTEAFRDNKTIEKVNERQGSESFALRTQSETVQNIPANDPHLAATLQGQHSWYETVSENGTELYVYLDPIIATPNCMSCHDNAGEALGVIKVVSSLAPIELAITKVRIQSTVVVGSALIFTLMLTGFVLGRSIVRPIETLSGAMARISSGEYESEVAVGGSREIKFMASSFNQMTTNLRVGYDMLLQERGKLTTVIESAQEAIVVTDSNDQIVLINSATKTLLGKTNEQIQAEGFLYLLDDVELMQRLLHASTPSEHTTTLNYKGRTLDISAATISDDSGRLIGSAALIRDVTEEHRLLEELKRISITDALTNVFNRRYIDATMVKEYERAQRSNKPFSVLLLDIDFFKKFNDTHGHDQGDRVLQAVGTCMKTVVRTYDSPCRYGGEEFVLILPETNEQGAVVVGERLREAVQAMVVDGLQVTISLGAATFPGLNVGSAEQLLEAADTALYKSKEAGRNRLTTATQAMVDKKAG